MMVTLTALVLLLAGAGFALRVAGEPAGSVVVAEVNGDPITVWELNHFAGEHRASVIERYSQLTEEAVDETFWHQEKEGRTPMEALREQSLADAIQMKIELQLAREHSIIESVSYESVMAQMEQENERRAAVVAKGGPIYGPLHFETHTFIDFFRSKTRTLLLEELALGELMPGEGELERYYEQQLPDLMPAEDRIIYDQYTITYLLEGEPNEALRIEAGRLAEELRQQLQSTSLGDQKLAADDRIHTEPGLVLDSANASRMYRSENALYMALHESATDQDLAVVIDDPASGSFLVVQVKEHQQGERPAFAAVRDQVRKVYLEQAYEDYVTSKVAEAQLVLLPELEEQTMGMTP
ncbi:hypothetical protein [Paenibacillus daejeonensis]|uniref:hypothetical protein n=1 Tax=Paenibacillus daejeonensis TaxID=135193 RepID=UPI00037D00C6|nr:hypothetical protein [Paenibacillus daejeonensis]